MEVRRPRGGGPTCYCVRCRLSSYSGQYGYCTAYAYSTRRADALHCQLIIHTGKL